MVSKFPQRINCLGYDCAGWNGIMLKIFVVECEKYVVLLPKFVTRFCNYQRKGTKRNITISYITVLSSITCIYKAAGRHIFHIPQQIFST